MAQATVQELQQMANKLRAHSIRMTTQSASGHPSTCCSMAEMTSVLFFDQMHFDPSQPKAHNVDEFVLSKGHAAPILWAALKEAGAIDHDLMTLRAIDSDIEGHPTPRVPWVRVATGSLGQGLSAACGISWAKRCEGISGHQVYVVLGDGEIAEGSVWEAVQFAVHHQLNDLCAIIDVNRFAQSGESYFGHDVEAVAKRFDGFGWKTIIVDGHNIEDLQKAFTDARAVSDQPVAIVARTNKGKGVELLDDKDNWHGKPVPADQVDAAIAGLGDINVELTVGARHVNGETPSFARTADVPAPRYEIGQSVATREAYGQALARLSKVYPHLIGLDADTKNSTFAQTMQTECPDRFVECYIAEQNMVTVALGLASMGWIPAASSFAAFLTRAYDSIRMGVVSQPERLILAGSHAGVSIGEDGPSQMALEDLAMIRALVSSTVVYPSDAVSAERLMDELVETNGISYMRTSRPKTPVLYDNNESFPIGGSKTLRSSASDVCTVVGAGVTLHEALKAYDMLQADGINIRVIDAYSIKPIDEASLKLAAQETGKIVTVEDHCIHGGLGDAVCHALAGCAPITMLGVTEIPRSGKPAELMAMHGIDANAIVSAVKGLQ